MNWVAVLDTDALSTEQLKVCKREKPALQGVILCADEPFDTRVKEICNKVDFFPAFCNTRSNQCLYGLRKTAAELAALDSSSSPIASTDARSG
jgi:hypothetical protein